MKTIRIIIILAVWATLAAGCGGGEKKQQDESEATTWAAMDDFHMLMADAYHPLKDDTNLGPAKSGAEALALEAEKWANSELPERVNNDDMKTRLQSLKANARAFADKVKDGAPDDELAPALTALHDEFHQIMEIWEGGGQHGGHH